MPAPKIAAEFTGHPSSAFLEGLPARDLTADEVDALSDDQRARLLANAASEHAVYVLHGRDLKAEAKEVAASSDEVQTVTMSVEPMTGGTAAPGGQTIDVKPATKADKGS
jgi:hypothetical protein